MKENQNTPLPEHCPFCKSGLLFSGSPESWHHVTCQMGCFMVDREQWDTYARTRPQGEAPATDEVHRCLDTVLREAKSAAYDQGYAAAMLAVSAGQGVSEPAPADVELAEIVATDPVWREGVELAGVRCKCEGPLYCGNCHKHGEAIARALSQAEQRARQAGREEAIREIRAAKKKQLVFCGKWKGKDEFQYSLHTYALGVLVDLHDALSKLSTPTDKE